MAYDVLIVEDDPMVSLINEEYVRKNKNFRVAGSARNGEQAIDFLRKNHVSLVILDVYMPLMDGVETLKKIREEKINTEVIMVTAANDTATLENTMHLGVVDYLVKPFAFERFQVALEKFSAKVSALEKVTVLDQNSIDTIISGRESKPVTSKKFPKGIQEKTLDLIREYLMNLDTWTDGDSIAENVKLSNVTVRHYMSYLVEIGEIKESINYETGGRPRSLYKKN